MRGEAVPERGDGALLLGVADVLDGDGGGEPEIGDAAPGALLPESVDGLPRERPDLPPAPVVLGVRVAQRYLVLVGMAHCRAQSAASVRPLLHQQRNARKMAGLLRRIALLPDIVATPRSI